LASLVDELVTLRLDELELPAALEALDMLDLLDMLDMDDMDDMPDMSFEGPDIPDMLLLLVVDCELHSAVLKDDRIIA